METIKNTAALVFLLGGAATDLKTKKITHKWLLLFFAAGAVLWSADLLQRAGAGSGAIRLPANLAPMLVQLMAAFLPGAAMLALSFAARGQIGRGDGFALLVLGFLLPARRIVLILTGAFYLSGFAAALLLVMKKASRGTRLPFLPFLAAAAAGVLLTEAG